MNVPPVLLGAALLTWGWHNDLLPVAVSLAILVELPRWVPWRWNLADRDFHRVADLSSIGFVLLAVYQFDTYGASAIYAILRWLPAVLGLLALAQLYSTRQRIDYTALFLSVRRAVARGTAPNPGGIDIRLPFLVICLVSASGGGAHPRWLFASLAALMLWMLWCNRPRRRGPVPWLGLIAVGLVVGFLTQAGFVKARRFLEPLAMAYLQERIAARSDPYRAYTAIGHIGELKLSNRILLRVWSDDGSRPPGLLRLASYETFARNLWVARRSKFEELVSEDEGRTWLIGESTPRERSANIGAHLPHGKGLLAVPGGTHRVEHLPVDGVYRNHLGSLKVLEGPELIQYRAHYTPFVFADSPPGESDLTLPGQHRALFVGLAERLELARFEERHKIERVRRFFSRGFSYTLNLQAAVDAPTPLAEFVLESRRGHCEYFATATVLLLRAAGIPARYATGYSVQEYSELEQRYVVRRRHAHSWALAYVNGAWRDVDTTPVVWSAMESAEAPWWQAIYDVGSWLAFRFAEWRWSESEDATPDWLLWLLLPLSVLLAWRLRRRERVVRDRRAGRSGTPGPVTRGADSAFYAIEKRLVASGHERRAGEPTAAWIRRLAFSEAIPGSAALLDDILPLHYRYRFHPAGLNDEDCGIFRRRVDEWLARNGADLVQR